MGGELGDGERGTGGGWVGGEARKGGRGVRCRPLGSASLTGVDRAGAWPPDRGPRPSPLPAEEVLGGEGRQASEGRGGQRGGRAPRRGGAGSRRGVCYASFRSLVFFPECIRVP